MLCVLPIFVIKAYVCFSGLYLSFSSQVIFTFKELNGSFRLMFSVFPTF